MRRPERPPGKPCAGNPHAHGLFGSANVRDQSRRGWHRAGSGATGSAGDGGAQTPRPTSHVSSRATLSVLVPKTSRCRSCAEARRTVVNWVGCALGGARHETLDNAIAALAPFPVPAQATVIGRRERSSAHRLAHERHELARTRLRRHAPQDRHPSGRSRGAGDPRARRAQPISGRDFLHALILGAEVECRIGNAVYPAHYDCGWHITGHRRRLRRRRRVRQAARAQRISRWSGRSDWPRRSRSVCARCSAQ